MFLAAALAAWGASADCGRCHLDHAAEWAVSAHARAADSPLYRALEILDRGASARDGAGSGPPCASCHGAQRQGIGCVECHTAHDTTGGGGGLPDLVRGPEGAVYGPIEKPVEARVHESSSSEIHGDERICAVCHGHAAGAAPCCTTVSDWRRSAMADFATCQSCHMRAVSSRSAARDGPSRTVHRHRFGGSDDLDQLRSGWDVAVQSAERKVAAVAAAVAVTNRSAHELPNGEPYFARVIMRARVLDRDGRALAQDERAFGFEMLDARGAPTVLPSRAARRGRSSALAAGETRVERFDWPASAAAAAIEITLWHVPFDPPPSARAWIDELRAWMRKEKPDWALDLDRLGAVFETHARPRLFARLVRSL
jgi:hypothetical protein